MRNLIVVICRWLVELTGSSLMPIPLGTVRALPEARRLIRLAEDTDRTGEWKRHSVYSKLIKQFPDEDKRDLALAIEVALRRWGSV
jgi:hypothetical protein